MSEGTTRSEPLVPAQSRGRPRGASGRPEKGRRRWGGDRVLFTHNYRIATELILQITPKFSKEVENLQK